MCKVFLEQKYWIVFNQIFIYFEEEDVDDELVYEDSSGDEEKTLKKRLWKVTSLIAWKIALNKEEEFTCATFMSDFGACCDLAL